MSAPNKNLHVTPELLELFYRYMTRHPYGCSLKGFFIKGNCADGDLDVMEAIMEPDDLDAPELLATLRELSYTQRKKVHAKCCAFTPEFTPTLGSSSEPLSQSDMELMGLV